MQNINSDAIFKNRQIMNIHMARENNDMLNIHIDGRMIYSSGIGRCLREIIKEIIIIDKNVKIDIYGRKADYHRYLQEYSINQHEIIFRENNSPIYSFREQIAGSINNLKKNKNDVFYYPHYNLPYLIQENSVFTIHDFTQFKFPEYFGTNKVKIARLILNNAVKKSKKIIVVSKSTAEDFYSYFPGHIDKVEIIYNAVSKDFRPLSDEEKELFIEKYKPGKYIMFVGNNKPHKNIAGLVKSFADIKKEFADFKLLIISKDFKLEDISIEEKIKDDITIIDSVSDDELVYYYNCASILVLPSFYEGFGLPVIEAMACGCPVVASNVSSMPELCGEAAILIDPYDADSITGGISSLLGNKGLRERFINKGYEQVKSFKWEITARNYVKVFRNIK